MEDGSTVLRSPYKRAGFNKAATWEALFFLVKAPSISSCQSSTPNHQSQERRSLPTSTKFVLRTTGYTKNSDAITVCWPGCGTGLPKKGTEFCLPKGNVLLPSGAHLAFSKKNERQNLAKTGLSIAEGGIPVVVGVPTGTGMSKNANDFVLDQHNYSAVLHRLIMAKQFVSFCLSSLLRLNHPLKTETANAEDDNRVVGYGQDHPWQNIRQMFSLPSAGVTRLGRTKSVKCSAGDQAFTPYLAAVLCGDL